MGLFSFLSNSFQRGIAGDCSRQQEKQVILRSQSSVPHTRDLMYPAQLPDFGEIAKGGHNDPRVIIYTMRFLDQQRKGPFSDEELSATDFGGKSEAYRIISEKGLIREPSKDILLLALYEKNELKSLLRERKMPVGGNKSELAARLLSSGFRIDRRKYRNRLFELTEKGVDMIELYRFDERQAICLTTKALKEKDYYGAISAYRDFDSKWGFVHTSGKKHTIFAHYDIPFKRFEFLEQYPMYELKNSDDFKRTLRACLIAGLMRGCQDQGVLAGCFGEVCREQIQCDEVVDLYRRGNFDDNEDREIILSTMQKNVVADSRCTLEYYISHVMYHARQVRE